MGFASASRFIGVQLDYCDKHELWKDPKVLKIIEVLAIELREADWDTVEDCYDSKTFQEVCKKSRNADLKDHWKSIKECMDHMDKN